MLWGESEKSESVENHQLLRSGLFKPIPRDAERRWEFLSETETHGVGIRVSRLKVTRRLCVQVFM